MKALALWPEDKILNVQVELDRADLERLLADEVNTGRIVRIKRLLEQTSAGPAEIVLELDLESAPIGDLIRRSLTNLSRKAQTLDGALVARPRSR